MPLIFLFLALTLTACQEERNPAPTAAESARLDEAEAMLNNEAAAQSAR
ncbi:MAG: hypothetical protein H0W92_02985 [Sphingomonas sp.]|nr:hypothetical protein [Sphingomonas sp.]